MAAQPFDQYLASHLVRPLARIGVLPNHVTAISLVLGLLAAGLFATGEPANANWGAGAFVLARFIDHVDGELARRRGTASRFGYFFDYVTGQTSYAALFIGMGFGLAGGYLGAWAYVLGAAGCISAVLGGILNITLDKRLGRGNGTPVGYPSFGAIDLEDGIYLIAPITWLGWLMPFFVAAGIGACIYCAWTFARVCKNTA